MNAIEVLRDYAVGKDAREALAALEQLQQAAEGIDKCDDYWDWVTGYAPQLRAALAAACPKSRPLSPVSVRH